MKLEAYIEERYGSCLGPVKQVSDSYVQFMIRNGVSIIDTDEGFLTYKPQGDMMFILDVYLDPKTRGKGTSKRLLKQVIDKAIEQDKRGIMTFTEHLGQNQALGRQAILGTGFKEHMKLKDKTVYIRGLN